MKKIIFLFFITAVLVACQNSGDKAQQYHGKALGTTYSIQYFSAEDKKLSKGIDSVFQAINHSISTYVNDSDISRINRGERVQVDSLFKNVFELSQVVYRKTDHYFDPTVGELVNAYGFGPEENTKSVSDIPLDKIMRGVGLNKLSINRDNYVIKENPEVYLDFNAIGKGYAVDELAHFLREQNLEDFLVEVGGEIVAHGQNAPDKDKWKIGIDSPDQSESEEIKNIATLKNEALATSGNYRKFRIDSASGEKFVHTINPKTGQAHKSNLLSASVIAGDCATADAYATAFMAMGFEKAKTIAEKESDAIAVYFIYSRDGDSKTYFSDGFKQKMIKRAD